MMETYCFCFIKIRGLARLCLKPSPVLKARLLSIWSMKIMWLYRNSNLPKKIIHITNPPSKTGILSSQKFPLCSQSSTLILVSHRSDLFTHRTSLWVKLFCTNFYVWFILLNIMSVALVYVNAQLQMHFLWIFALFIHLHL